MMNVTRPGGLVHAPRSTHHLYNQAAPMRVAVGKRRRGYSLRRGASALIVSLKDKGSTFDKSAGRCRAIGTPREPHDRIFFWIGPRYHLSTLGGQNRMLLDNMLSTSSGPLGVLRASTLNIPDSHHHSLKYFGGLARSMDPLSEACAP